MPSQTSPFFSPGPVATPDSLAIIHLKRDHQIPAVLRTRDDDDEGYKEGKVVNTQFGSFPHNSLIGLPWGSQVRALKVDTGSRGRRGKAGDKRKREVSEDQETERQDDSSGAGKATETASSGFMHLLPPTPENWTLSLPHRTQVVYTPDYSYILHRLRARPGTSIIEAGAGSGSFTHASARAVFSGYPLQEADNSQVKKRKIGKVWSFEFHEQRHAKLEKEIRDHNLDGVVQITHRDVCRDGFLVGSRSDESPLAEAVFLDLPAPWLALPYLTRRNPAPKPEEPSSVKSPSANPDITVFPSALCAQSAVHLCTFSPCIEQVQRTVSTLRQLGWVEICVVEIAHKRFEIRRERIGIENGLQRGTQATAANVEEAVARLKEVEGRFKSFHGQNERDDSEEEGAVKTQKRSNEKNKKATKQIKKNPNTRERLLESLVHKKGYKEGRLTHRPDQELKTHTSYLLFAVLPQEWSDEDEENARAKWPNKKKETSGCATKGAENFGMSRREIKKAARHAQKEHFGREKTENGEPEPLDDASKPQADGGAHVHIDSGVSANETTAV